MSKTTFNAFPAIQGERKYIMGRKANPDTINRSNLITRTIEEHTFSVSYVVTGSKSVTTEEVIVRGSEDACRRLVQRTFKARGILTDIEHVSDRAFLIGQTLDEFIDRGMVLKTYDSVEAAHKAAETDYEQISIDK